MCLGTQQLPQGQTVQGGQTLEGDCSSDRGCVVSETKPNSVGEKFAQLGGGVSLSLLHMQHPSYLSGLGCSDGYFWHLYMVLECE